MHRATVVAAIIAAIPMAHAGSAIVVNKCDTDVNVWTADRDRSQRGPFVVKANNAGTPWSEEYYHVEAGGGVSIKMTTSDSCEGAITQYEYTYDLTGTPDLWYDISNVNCKESDCPFWSWGFYLDAPIAVSCAANIVCDAVYNLYNDDKATHGTTSDQDLTLYLCGQDGSSSGIETVATPAATSSSSVATYSAPVSSYVAPTSTYTPTPTSTPTPTTLFTATPSAALVQAENVVDEGNYIITEVVTEYATAVVTAYAKRSPEPQAHAHHKRAHNHHGHPHWRK